MGRQVKFFLFISFLHLRKFFLSKGVILVLTRLRMIVRGTRLPKPASILVAIVLGFIAVLASKN